MAKTNLLLLESRTQNRTVTPRRLPNRRLRAREQLTADEVERLIEAAGTNRYGARDALIVLAPDRFEGFFCD